MLLAIDVGNTQTVLGLLEGESLVKMWRVKTLHDVTADEMKLTLRGLLDLDEVDSSAIDGAVLATVVPSQRQLWKSVCESSFGVDMLSVSAEALDGLIEVKTQGTGADRLANAVAGSVLYGNPVIVVDLGTATDMEVVDESGAFLGGAIAPGVQTSLWSLVKGTSLLPAIELADPGNPIGADTVSAIQSGAVLGEVDRIDGLVKRMWKQLGYTTPVVATGGLSVVIGPLCETVTAVNPELTLQGLRIVFEHARR